MSEYKKIEKELNSCNQSKLQDIVYRIIDNTYNYPKNLVYLGGAKNDDKTRWGTPDVFFQLDDGSYIFVEITTQKTRLNKKILDDLEKCKKEAKNNNIKVSKVIYVCSFKPKINNIEAYKSKCDEFCKSNAFEFWGIDRLADMLISSFRNLAVDELNVCLTLSSLQTVDEYLKTQKFDVSQTHEFLYRESELEEIISSLIDHKTVLLYGSSGCGKTRLCFQAAKVLKEKFGFKETYFIKSAVNSTLNDLKTAFNGEKALFILDDVNHIPYLIDFLNYSKTNNNFFVLATVRDYAFDEIKKNLWKKGYNNELKSLLISALSEKQQNEIVKKILPNANYDILRAIQNISKGNLRFSIMCAETIKTSNQIPKDLENLLERYFKQIEVDLDGLKVDVLDKSSQRSLILLSLLHRIIIPVNDEDCKNSLNLLLSKLGIEYHQFINAMIFLKQYEIIGISFDGQVYEIKDQILANYLFYKLVFKCNKISFSLLLDTLFPEYRSAFEEILDFILFIYGFTKPIEEELKKSWNAIDNERKIVPFLEAFYHLIPLETLNYIKEHLVSSNSWIDILSKFEATLYDEVAIDLLIEIIKLKPTNLNLNEIVELFGIHKNSFEANFHMQIYLLKKLKVIILDNDIAMKLFLQFCQELLNFNFRFNEIHGKTVAMFETHIIPVECTFKMRSIIWEGIFSLFNSNHATMELIQILSHHRFFPRDGLPNEYKEILKSDQQCIIKGISKIDLCSQSFEKKIIIKRMLECCYPEENEKFKELVSVLEKDSIFKIFSFVDSRSNCSFIFDVHKKEAYEKNYGKLLSSINMPSDFFTFIKELGKININDSKKLLYLNYFFQYIHDYYPEKYLGTLKLLFEQLPDVLLISRTIIKNAIDVSNWTAAFTIIQQANISNKNVWLLEIFSQLEEKNLNETLYTQCLNLICNEILTDYENDIRYFDILNYLPFEKYKSGFVKVIFEAIGAIGKIDLEKYRIIENCYNSELLKAHKMTFDDFSNLFGEEESLYIDLFFTMVRKNVLISSGDFEKYLLLKDEDYLYRYYDICFEPTQDIHNLTINLLRETVNPCGMMLNVYKRAINNKKLINICYALVEIIKANFSENSIADFINMFLHEFHNEKSNLTILTNLMCCMDKEWQFIFVEKLIESKINIQLFQDLPVFSYPFFWSGYELDMLESRVSMLQEFLIRMKPDIVNINYLKCLNDRLQILNTQIEEAKLKELYD